MLCRKVKVLKPVTIFGYEALIHYRNIIRKYPQAAKNITKKPLTPSKRVTGINIRKTKLAIRPIQGLNTFDLITRED